MKSLLIGLLETIVTLDNCKCVAKLIISHIVMEGIPNKKCYDEVLFSRNLTVVISPRW